MPNGWRKQLSARLPYWWALLYCFFFTIAFTAIRAPKVNFFPSGDPNFVYVYLTLPIGTDQAYTNEVTKDLEKRVAAVVEPDKDIVTSVISNVEKSVTDPQDEDQGQYTHRSKVTVAFEEFSKRNGKDTKVILERIRKAVVGIPGATIAVNQENAGPPVQKDISIEIIGDNLDTLVHTGERLKKFIDKQNIAGIEGLVPDVQADKPQLIFDINRETCQPRGHQQPAGYRRLVHHSVRVKSGRL